ncbi:MAG: leucine-rich repeat domain-containing protein [Ignavibacteriaceae bacterium]|nr:leucine-rich repeat domain-containing protein [Ignavibacteriaceae bacterium]
MKNIIFILLTVLIYCWHSYPSGKFPNESGSDTTFYREPCEIYFFPYMVGDGDTVTLILKRILPDGSLADYPSGQLFDISYIADNLILQNGNSVKEVKNIRLPVRLRLGYMASGKRFVNAYVDSSDIHAYALIKDTSNRKVLKNYTLTAPDSFLLARMKQSSGYHKLRLGNFKGAREYFEDAIKTDPSLNYLFFHDIACTYSIEGNKPEAIKWLRKAFDNGYIYVHHAIHDDKDLENIRSMTEFRGIVTAPLVKERKELSDSINANPAAAGELFYQTAWTYAEQYDADSFYVFLEKSLKTGYYPDNENYYAFDDRNINRMDSLLNKYVKNAENKLFSCSGFFRYPLIIRKLKCDGIPDGLSSLDNLEVLIITGHVNLTFKEEDLGSRKKLKTLEFPNSGLEWIPKEVTRLENLEEITIHHGSIDRLPFKFGNLQKLQFASFCNCKLIMLTPSISQCVNLKKILLANNLFTDFPDDILNIVSLEEIDLSNNQIEEFPEGIGNLINLRSLNLSNNLISKLPAEMGKLRNLKTLDLKGNSIPVQEINQLRTQLPGCTIEE